MAERFRRLPAEQLYMGSTPIPGSILSVSWLFIARIAACFSPNGNVWAFVDLMKEDFSNSSLSIFFRDLLKFGIVVEKDEDGYYIASVPELLGCHTQAKTLDELTRRIKEAIQTYLETEGTRRKERIELVGFQFVEVPVQ